MKTKTNPQMIYIKKISKIKPIRFIISIGLIILIGYLVLNYVPFVSKYNAYVVQTGSMEPLIMKRDLVIINTDASIDDLDSSQSPIIAFKTDINDDGIKEIVVHYLDSVVEEEGVKTYLTKAAVSDELDTWSLSEVDIVGVHVNTVSGLGGILLFVQSSIGKIVVIADILIIYLLIDVVFDHRKKELSKLNKEI